MTWTTPEEIHRRLERRWRSGEFLARFAEGRPWEPLSIPIKGPRAGELAGRFDEVRAWITRWEKIDPTLMRVEYKEVGVRTIGANRVPARVGVDGYDELWAVLRVTNQVQQFQELHAATVPRAPAIAAWMRAQPMKALEHSSHWPELIETVLWIDQHATPRTYLRQVDVPGVDTKFIERYKSVLATLLDQHLPSDRVNTEASRSDLASRYDLQGKPGYVRLRRLDGQNIGGFTELTVRAAELTRRPDRVTRVFIVENEITYLAFPDVYNALAIHGNGYAVTALRSCAWLADTDLVYWGDIDTHGLAILDRLRSRFPNTRSMLMDRATLLEHRRHWGREPTPTNTPLEHLTTTETELYTDLIGNTLGPSIRLEQERIRFSSLTRCLTRLVSPATDAIDKSRNTGSGADPASE